MRVQVAPRTFFRTCQSLHGSAIHASMQRMSMHDHLACLLSISTGPCNWSDYFNTRRVFLQKQKSKHVKRRERRGGELLLTESIKQHLRMVSTTLSLPSPPDNHTVSPPPHAPNFNVGISFCVDSGLGSRQVPEVFLRSIWASRGGSSMNTHMWQTCAHPDFL